MRTSQSGISIVETTIALLILATIGGALLALNVQIQSAANSSKFKSVAESDAQKMLEQVRNKKNTLGGISGLENGCYSDPLGSPNLSGCDRTNSNTPKYVLIADGGGGKQVKAVVNWREKGKVYYVEIDTYLYDY